MKIQKGFIQIPILIAIIVGGSVLSGAGYVGVKQYQNYQVEKMKKEKEAQEREKEVQMATRSTTESSWDGTARNWEVENWKWTIKNSAKSNWTKVKSAEY